MRRLSREPTAVSFLRVNLGHACCAPTKNRHQLMHGSAVVGAACRRDLPDPMGRLVHSGLARGFAERTAERFFREGPTTLTDDELAEREAEYQKHPPIVIDEPDDAI